MYANFNSSTPFITYIKFSATEPSEQEFDEYLKSLSKVLEDQKPMILIFDSTETKYLASEMRIKQGVWLKQNEQELRKYIKGGVFIIPSMVMRIIFNCILAIQKLPYPYTVVANKDEAMKWATEKTEQLTPSIKA